MSIAVGTGVSLYSESSIEEAEFEDLIEQCRGVLVERQFNARVEYMASRWETGQLVSRFYEKYEKRDGAFGQLASSLQIGESELYRAVQFYEKFPALDWDSALQALPEGKNLSWNRVKTELLPETGAAPKKRKDIDGAIRYSDNCVGQTWTRGDADQVRDYLSS